MEHHLDALIQISIDAGKLAASLQKKDLQVDIKPDDTQVSDADIAVNKFILEKLTALNLDNVLLVGEESVKSSFDDYGKGKIICFDPIDGTSGYVKGTGDWCVMIGYMKDGKPLLGVVYHEAVDTVYYAVSGKGAYSVKSGVKTKLQCIDRDPSVCIASISYPPKGPSLALLTKLGIKEFSHRGSMGLKCCDIATGISNIYLNLDKKSSMWDSLAPTIILSESGALPILTIPEFTPISYSGSSLLHDYEMVACTPKLFQRIGEKNLF